MTHLNIAPIVMLTDHDQEMQLRCRRLGHEVPFGYCRQESRGRPCRLILDCWWERFDVRVFLQAHLPQEVLNHLEGESAAGAPSKVLSLVNLIQQTQERLGVAPPESKE